MSGLFPAYEYFPIDSITDWPPSVYAVAQYGPKTGIHCNFMTDKIKARESQEVVEQRIHSYYSAASRNEAFALPNKGNSLCRVETDLRREPFVRSMDHYLPIRLKKLLHITVRGKHDLHSTLAYFHYPGDSSRSKYTLPFPHHRERLRCVDRHIIPHRRRSRPQHNAAAQTSNQ